MQTSNNFRYLRSPWEVNILFVDTRTILDDNGEPVGKK